MVTIDHTLLYLREALANYIENDLCQQIYRKIENNHYENEEYFIKDLNDKEMTYLDNILRREINYARNVANDERVTELNEVYELLF